MAGGANQEEDGAPRAGFTFVLGSAVCGLDASGPLLILDGEDELGRSVRLRARGGAACLRAKLPPAACAPTAEPLLKELVAKLNDKLARRYSVCRKEYTDDERSECQRVCVSGGKTPKLVRDFTIDRVTGQLTLVLVHPEHVAWAASALRSASDGGRGNNNNSGGAPKAWFQSEYVVKLWEGAESARPDGAVLEVIGEARYERAALTSIAGGPARVGDALRVDGVAFEAAADVFVPLTALSKAEAAASGKRKRGAPPTRAPAAPPVPAGAACAARSRGVSRVTLFATADAGWAVGAPDALDALLRGKGSRWRPASVQAEPGGARCRGAYHHGAVDIERALPATWATTMNL